ncbi:hypothetical protein [Bacillus massiliigorillae]|nr:hypothetical protein [Bacillus massiliigorillae]
MKFSPFRFMPYRALPSDFDEGFHASLSYTEKYIDVCQRIDALSKRYS